MLFSYILVATALAAGSVKASPLPISNDGKLIKRCGFAAECITSTHAITNANENTHTKTGGTQSTATSFKDMGNQSMIGNNKGGMNNSGGVQIGSVCRRDLTELRQEEVANLAKRSPGGVKPPHPPPMPAGGVNPNALRNKILAGFNLQFNQKTNSKFLGSDNTTMRKDIERKQDISMKNQSGTGAGNGMMCKRALDEFEVEKREIDRGGSVLAAIGGTLPDSSNVEPVHVLATRDLGRLAESLNVRAVGHDQAASSFKRDVGIECESQSCDELTRREAHDILVSHARTLGFSMR